MEQNDKQKAEEAFIESCPLHDLKHNVCTDGIGGTECDGDCKYTKRFIIMAKSNLISKVKSFFAKVALWFKMTTAKSDYITY